LSAAAEAISAAVPSQTASPHEVEVEAKVQAEMKTEVKIEAPGCPVLLPFFGRESHACGNASCPYVVLNWRQRPQGYVKVLSMPVHRVLQQELSETTLARTSSLLLDRKGKRRRRLDG